MKELLDMKLGERTREITMDMIHNRPAVVEEDPKTKKAKAKKAKKKANDMKFDATTMQNVDLPTLHEAYQFLTTKYVENVANERQV